MQNQFLTILKKKSYRQRFYSSMTHDQYCDVYGPPAPLFKPQEDPTDDIPLLDLEVPIETSITKPENEEAPQILTKMDTILEIEGSENFTQNQQRSPRNDFFSSGRKSREFLGTEELGQGPKRVRVRMRSQSDNSQYLIFNFLQRVNEKGRKKVKHQ